MEGLRNSAPGLLFCTDWRFGVLKARRSKYFRGINGTANGGNTVEAIVFGYIWRRLMRSLANSMKLGATLAKR